jgi:hypothetical protein
VQQAWRFSRQAWPQQLWPLSPAAGTALCWTFHPQVRLVVWGLWFEVSWLFGVLAGVQPSAGWGSILATDTAVGRDSWTSHTQVCFGVWGLGSLGALGVWLGATLEGWGSILAPDLMSRGSGQGQPSAGPLIHRCALWYRFGVSDGVSVWDFGWSHTSGQGQSCSGPSTHRCAGRC